MKTNIFLNEHMKLFFAEDGMDRNFHYLNSLPKETVSCKLKLKDNLLLAGLPFFFETFNYLSDHPIDYSEYMKFEGQVFKKNDGFEISFELPFNLALSCERLALNLLQRASSIASYTHNFVLKAGDIKILDTRKTTPGLRSLEKYAVKIAGGFNHRFSQTDAWMIKDNHKQVFGGVKEAIYFFKQQNTFYTPMILEIHDLSELKDGIELGVKHFLLDNFSPAEIKEAVSLKNPGTTYEVSGGINMNNIDGYLLDGVDAISSGSIIYNAPQVDISLKMSRL